MLAEDAVMHRPRFAPLLLVLSVLASSPARAAGDIILDVDVTESARQLFHAHEVIPVKSGSLTLYYPKWIPGEHSPSGPLENLVGLKFSAGGKTLAWRRDPVNMFAISLEVPKGTTSLEVNFDFLSPTDGGEFGQSASATPDLVDLEWNQVLLYPAGAAAKDIVFEPGVKLPAGWQFASALEPAAGATDGSRFKPVSLENLVDSPLIAGRYFRRVDLAPGDKVPVYLDVVADTADDLAISPEETQDLGKLVKQAYTLFGGHHYAHYDFLLTLSANTGHFGLEHHQSSDNRSWPDFFTDPGTALVAAHLLPHEYVHSWNGKFRRPAGLWTPDFNSEPMKGDMLWVYEGLTEYLGNVLAARSGVLTQAQYRDQLATDAAFMDNRPGRTWRPLQDTADEAQILYYAPRSWETWRRVQDFYREGELLWLDVDTKIRELSVGQRSLDDFAHVFYSMDDGSYTVKTFSFDELVAALKQVQDYDWAAFLRTRLESTQLHAPLDGIARGGYRLSYSDTPSDYFKANEKLRKSMNMMFSIGFMFGPKGQIMDVLWGSPAFKAGLGPGMQLVAVNGRALDADMDVLKDALVAAKSGLTPIHLLVRNQDQYVTFDVDYHDGLKYPVLERLPGTAPVLDAITTAR